MAEKSKETKTKLYKIGEIRQYKHGTGVNFFYSENSAISLNIFESLGKGVKEAIWDSMSFVGVIFVNFRHKTWP